MGVAGAVGMGVGSGPTLVTAGSLGDQRTVVGSALGTSRTSVGIREGLQNESFQDVVVRGEQFISLYNHRLGVSQADGRSSGPRNGGSFVAYVGGDVRIHATCRDEEGSVGAGSRQSGSPVPFLSTTRSGNNEEGEAVETQSWHATATASNSRRATELRQADGKDTASVAEIRGVETSLVGDTGATIDVGGIEAARKRGQLQLQTLAPLRQRGGPGSSPCQECGNQAKKDCSHLRCRTCCKSRGFDCATHVKSTWVPASKRRARQHAQLTATVEGQSTPKSKRARSLALVAVTNVAASYTSTSTATPRNSNFNSSQFPPQESSDRTNLPSEVRAEALFKCLKVTCVGDGEDEYAYQAIVKIGGHIFKGMLYDQGIDQWTGHFNTADLQSGGRNASLNTAMIDPVAIYEASGSTLLGVLR